MSPAQILSAVRMTQGGLKLLEPQHGLQVIRTASDDSCSGGLGIRTRLIHVIKPLRVGWRTWQLTANSAVRLKYWLDFVKLPALRHRKSYSFNILHDVFQAERRTLTKIRYCSLVPRPLPDFRRGLETRLSVLRSKTSLASLTINRVWLARLVNE